MILPFSIAILLLISHQYMLDPLLVLLFRSSETTPFKTITIREPYVRKLLYQRSLILLAATVGITAALVILFVFVPGHRL